MIKYLLTIILIASSPKGIVNDLMLLGNLHPDESQSRELKLHGKTNSVIDVLPEDGKLISCQFIDQSGIIGLTQENVEKCTGHLVTANPMTLTVKVTNPNKVDTGYSIHLVETK